MSETRVKIQSIVENQLPEFVAEENPLLVDFLNSSTSAVFIRFFVCFYAIASWGPVSEN